MQRRELLRRASVELLAAPAILAAGRARAAESVDVELVLAVDASCSVDVEEQELQMRGYAQAFRDPRLADGISRGAIGAIAVSLFVWSDWNVQELLVRWCAVHDRASANRLADAIDAAPRTTYLYTSISAAIDYAGKLFGQGYEGTRQVVDISGDGINNSGRPLKEAIRRLWQRVSC